MGPRCVRLTYAREQCRIACEHWWGKRAKPKRGTAIAEWSRSQRALFVTDAGGHHIRRLDLVAGRVRTWLGDPSQQGGRSPGRRTPWAQATLYYPSAPLLLPGACAAVSVEKRACILRRCEFNLRRPGSLQVSVTVSRQADGVVVSAPLSLRLPAEPSDDPHAVQLTGLTPVIEAPRDVVGHEATIRAKVTSSDGTHGEDPLQGTVAWGLDSCGGHG